MLLLDSIIDLGQYYLIIELLKLYTLMLRKAILVDWEYTCIIKREVVRFVELLYKPSTKELAHLDIKFDICILV